MTNCFNVSVLKNSTETADGFQKPSQWTLGRAVPTVGHWLRCSHKWHAQNIEGCQKTEVFSLLLSKDSSFISAQIFLGGLFPVCYPIAWYKGGLQLPIVHVFSQRLDLKAHGKCPGLVFKVLTKLAVVGSVCSHGSREPETAVLPLPCLPGPQSQTGPQNKKFP